MALLDINWNPSRRELRQFAGVLVVVAAVAVTVIYRRHGLNGYGIAIGSLALIIGTLAVLFPPAVGVVYRIWMAAVLPIGWIVSHAAVAATYFFVVTPIGLVMRAIRRDPLRKEFDQTADTYWERRNDSDDMKQFFRQF